MLRETELAGVIELGDRLTRVRSLDEFMAALLPGLRELLGDDPIGTDHDLEILALLRPAIVLAHRLAAQRERERRDLHAALVARGLTERQAEVVQTVASGTTNAQAALLLHVSEATIAKHLERAYRKLGVGTRGAAVALALDAAA